MTPRQGGQAEKPDRIGPYRIEEPLGKGGMGAVWRAWDGRLERWVAVKRTRVDATVQHLRERLRREARAAARLNHPAIVQVYDLVEDENGDWLVMELVAGETLEQALTREGPLSPERLARLGRDLAAGLAEAHAHGILHRDLKASNVMLTVAGGAKILDFGIAKHLAPAVPAASAETAVDSATLSGAGQILGTCFAMSPEQAMGAPLDPRSDLFSLGTLLYEAATGIHPFKGNTSAASLARVLHFRPRPLAESRPEIPRELSELTARLLEKERTQRPESAGEVAAVLGGLALAGPPLPAPGDETIGATLDLQPAAVLPAVLEDRPAASAERRRRERRPVTVVCCGLLGVDATSGAVAPLDLEALSENLNLLQDLAQSVCAAFDGHPGAVHGNLLWLYFGYPRAHEDDARRAVLAARELCSRADTPDLSGTAGGPLLAVRAAVHSAPAIVATHSAQGEPVQLGSELDLVSGLQAIAPLGEVVVSEATRQLLARSFATEALPPAHLPGREGPVAAHRVLGALDPDTAGASPFLVGRASELALLEHRFHLACAGSGQAVLLGGEAGMGKSTLVRALRERVGEGAAVWLSAYGSPFTQSSPLAPIISLFERTILPAEERVSAADPLERLKPFLAGLGLDSPENVSLLAAFLDLDTAGLYPPLGLNPEAQRKRTFDLLLAVLAALVDERPLALCREQGDGHQLFLALYHLWLSHNTQGRLSTLTEMAELCDLAQTPEERILGLNAQGTTAFYHGEARKAKRAWDEIVEHYRAVGDNAPAQGEDPVGLAVAQQYPVGYFYQSWSLWRCGQADTAVAVRERAIPLAEEVASPHVLGMSYLFAGVLSEELYEPEVAARFATRCFDLSREHGFPHLLALADHMHGWVAAQQGETERGLSLLRAGLASYLALGHRCGTGFGRALLIQALLDSGAVAEGLAEVEDALAISAEQYDRFQDGELHRLRGELLLLLPEPDEEGAAAEFATALAITREQGALAYELRAATSWSRLLQRQGRAEEARALLGGVYGQFTEGFGTHDLRVAAALLTELEVEVPAG